MQHRFRVKSLVYEFVNEDGTVEDRYLEDSDESLGYIRFAFSPEDERQHFWIGSSHEGLMDGNYIIATPVPNAEFDAEKIKDRTNQLIGLIRDGHCNVYCSYDVPEVGIKK